MIYKQHFDNGEAKYVHMCYLESDAGTEFELEDQRV